MDARARLAASGTDEGRERWRHEIRRELFRWHSLPEGCRLCGERIGHFGGDMQRDPCALIPHNVPLEEVRPNCYAVRRHWIGDVIRAVERRA